MTTVDQINREAAELTEEQQAATLAFIHALRQPLFYHSAPAEAIAGLERGLAEIERGETVAGQDLFDSIARKLRSAGA